jgi:hypothetical protein
MNTAKKILIRAPMELAEKVEADAKEEGISQNEYLLRAIANYLICKAPQRIRLEGSITIKHENV